jgi:hypothetical protein
MNIYTTVDSEKITLIKLECVTGKKAVLRQIQIKHSLLPEEHSAMRIVGWIRAEALFGKDQPHDMGLVIINDHLYLISLNRSAWGTQFVEHFYRREQIIVT